MSIRLLLVVSTALLFAGTVLAHGQAAANPSGQHVTDSSDKYLWLEEVAGDRATAWVRADNARTASVLQSDPRFATLRAQALQVLGDPNRVPYPSLYGDQARDFWQDKDHQRGLWRQTTLSDYVTAEPHWRTLLDIDALNRTEQKKWVYKGTERLYPGNRFVLVNLSDGGEDATVAREFDLSSGTFVKSGFDLPRSKQDVTWLDKDTLLVARDWGAGTMTKSGYPFVVKQWKRGTPLTSAVEVFRGTPDDMSVGTSVLNDSRGNRLALVVQSVSFFEQKTFLLIPDGTMKSVSIPPKSNFAGMLDGRVLLHLRQDWTPQQSGPTFVSGSLLSLNVEELRSDPAHLKPSVVFAPTATEFLQGYATTRSRFVLTTLQNVAGRAYVYQPDGPNWKRNQVPVPGNVTVDIISADPLTEAYVLSVVSFLTPPSQWLGQADTPEAIKVIKTQPPQFDASNLAVEQFFAMSKDGTKVPYFVVHRQGMKLDGTNATLLYGYGGFEVALTPYYDAQLGKLWLERGGVYVLANIRGGGEFGPAWHEAGLKTKRQVIYDDFAAVGEDLVRRRITSPRHLGIEGGSNGGLLMGVEMEQHPDSWNAVVIQVPLLDMLRFEQIAAGASWVGEYGSVSVPEQRAFLAGISPYNNLKRDAKYPEPLIFTTTKDDRVGPQHARKFAAKIAEYKLPYLFDEITEGGHGDGADLNQEAGTSAETFVYLTRKLMD